MLGPETTPCPSPSRFPAVVLTCGPLLCLGWNRWPQHQPGSLSVGWLVGLLAGCCWLAKHTPGGWPARQLAALGELVDLTENRFRDLAQVLRERFQRFFQRIMRYLSNVVDAIYRVLGKGSCANHSKRVDAEIFPKYFTQVPEQDFTQSSCQGFLPLLFRQFLHV